MLNKSLHVFFRAEITEQRDVKEMWGIRDKRTDRQFIDRYLSA